ncbi:cyclic nucleotide-binding domain-containing protein [Candidatus Enterococcus mansonii]|uniref:Cyclic nucleotide-binding domain-containing protein n=1 Tax=Candidatus Enterococcus mansonii TaxID=1834181 RepID=A0A242CBX8_9ENTE|nr:cyclic nucleotide-binding domain-containing protein [Enterococcus sp. 4G2_DIV0659]OTO07765.1 hypothetical protein A5880_002035 [Enterococcus sp. 4G2_DIV0659]
MKIIDDLDLLVAKITEHHLDSYIQKRHYPQILLSTLQEGESLYKQDEFAEYFCIMLSGKIRVYRTLSNGKEAILNVITGFRILGEIELIYNNPSLNSIEFLEPSSCLLIPMNYCRDELLNDTNFVKKVAYNLAMTLHAVETNTSINMSFTLENRVASYILASEKDGSFELDLSTLPELIGTTYRHLLRVIKKFQEEGLIKKKGDRYLLLQKSVLSNKISDLYSL